MAYQYSANGILHLLPTNHQNFALSMPQIKRILNDFLDSVCEEETQDYLQLKKENYLLKHENNQKPNVESKKALEDEVIRLNHHVSEVEEINKKQFEKIYVLENQLKAIRHILDGETNVDEVKVTEMIPNSAVSEELKITNKKQLYMISDLQKQRESYRILRDGEKKNLEVKVASLEALNEKHLEKISDLKKQQEANVQAHNKEKNLHCSKIAKLEVINQKHLEYISSNNDSRKILENEITRLNQINMELMVTKTKHLQKISDMEKQQASRDKAITNEKKTFTAKVAELEAVNKKNVEKIAALEKQKQACRRGACDGKKKVVENQVPEAKGVETKLVNTQRLIIKKLCKVKNLNKWQVTLEKTFANLSTADSNNLLFDAIAPGKQLVLKGVVSQYESDPFKNNAIVSICDQLMVSNMLTNVQSCQLTEIYLCNQRLTSKEYEKLISNRAIESFYFSGGEILSNSGKSRKAFQLIIKTLPMIKRFAYLRIGNFHNGTFRNLIKLPVFTKLEEFKLDSINYYDFDAESFLMFMKKYPNVRITLGFVHKDKNDKAKLNTMKQLLLSRASAKNMFEIKY